MHILFSMGKRKNQHIDALSGMSRYILKLFDTSKTGLGYLDREISMCLRVERKKKSYGYDPFIKTLLLDWFVESHSY